MSHCKDCKHFVERIEDTYIDPPTGFGMCSITETHANRVGDSSRLAFAQDADEYNAWLVVAPEFGCVQFEAKD